MIDSAIREALRKIGTRTEALGSCPICGGPIRSRQDRVRAWPGTDAHSSCASYRRRNSQRVHESFTAP
jgi:hypothetical protein